MALVMVIVVPALGAPKPLTLKQALKIALEKNLEVKLAKLEAEKGQTHVNSAESTFDTTATATADWKDDRDKSTSTSLVGTKNITENFNAGLTKKIMTGTSFDLQFKNVHKETDATSAALKTYWDPKLELNITQPILKNFFGVNDRNNLKIGELKNILSRYRSEDQLETALSQISKLYWDFSAAQESLHIKKEALEHAKKLHAANKKKLKLGTLEETDLLASEANVLSRENDTLIAQNTWELAHENLKVALEEKTSLIFVPKDPVTFQEETLELSKSIEEAFKNKKEYLVAQKELEQKNISLSISKNSLFPQIDLVATLASNGLDKDYPKAVNDIGSLNYPTYYAGITFKFPFENNLAKSTYDQNRIEKLTALYKFQKLQNEIHLDIAQHLKTLTTFALKAQTSEKITALLKKKMLEEEKKFNQGRSSINFVIQFQEDTLNSSIQKIQATLDYEKARLDFKKAQGTLLDELLKKAL